MGECARNGGAGSIGYFVIVHTSTSTLPASFFYSTEEGDHLHQQMMNREEHISCFALFLYFFRVDQSSGKMIVFS